MAFFGKTGFIAAAGMLLAGGILLSIGAANGGIEQVQAMAANGELSIGGRRLSYLFSNRHSYPTEEVALETTIYLTDWEGAVEEAVYDGFVYSEQEIEFLESGRDFQAIATRDEIEKLLIDEDAFINGDLSIYSINSDYFEMITDEDVTYEISGDTLKISGKKGREGRWGETILYIPEGWAGESINISVGAGMIYAEALNADEIEIQVGAGYMNTECLTADELKIVIGTGSLELYNEFQAEDVEIKIGMGSVNITDGMITGDLKVDCGVGELTMFLRGEASEHNYKVSSKGELNIGYYNQAGFSNNYEINNGVDSNFEVKCGLGSVNIYFN